MIRTVVSKTLSSRAVVGGSMRLASKAFSSRSISLSSANAFSNTNNITSKPVRSINLITKRCYSAGPAPLTQEFVLERIVGLLESYSKVSESAQLTTETSFSKDLGLDSLDVVEVVLAIEEEFSILIPDHEADEIKTVGQAVDYIMHQPDAY